MAEKIYYPIRRTMFHATKSTSPCVFECEAEADYLEVLKNGWVYNPADLKNKKVEPVNEDVVEAEAEKEIKTKPEKSDSPYACNLCDFIGKNKHSLGMHRFHVHKE